MLGEGKRLYNLGYAIHWLKPNSKRPQEEKWTTGDRKSWRELKESYQYGSNIGVRLGAPSKFKDGTYLAVIDCDVKSSSRKHRGEMEKKLLELTQGVKAPIVMSGRGNGSHHIHIKTNEPIAPFRFSQSSEKVKVPMPSAKPSKHEKATLSAEELEEGIRLRPAWEISVMGEGQQVVLPPSTHPDTGDSYEWGRRLESEDDLPLFVNLKGSKKKSEDVKHTPFKVCEIDVMNPSLTDETIKLIETGEGSSGDRSADLMTAVIALLKARFSDDEILTWLTDESTYLGATGYEHANTSSRTRAAEWVRRYTLSKAKRETLASHQFDDEAEVTVLDDDAAKAQEASLMEGRPWQSLLERTQTENGPGRIKPTSMNLRLIFENAVAPNLVRRDQFAETDVYGVAPPWNESRPGQEIRDIDLVNAHFWIAANFKVEFSTDRILQGLQEIAAANKFHPVKDYLNGIEWDGKPRLDTWLKRYLGAKGDPNYLAAVGRKTLCAMIARIYEPGCKFDHVLILEGIQGVGKSSAVRILAHPWFSDSHLNIADKDAVVGMRSIWVREIGELAGMRKADVDMLKEFISSPVDRIRVPYGRLAESFPRQCIFIGTTNNEEYLRDASGNRRFWPVEVGECDIKALKRDRDQLLAEARFDYDLGEPLWLEDKAVEAIAKDVQHTKTFEDALTEKLGDFLKKEHENFDPKHFTLWELADEFSGSEEVARLLSKGVAGQMRVAAALKKLGYKLHRIRIGGERKSVWQTLSRP